MKIRKVRKINYITFTYSNQSEYIGESFELVQDPILGQVIKDWINGGLKDPDQIGSFERGSGWDFDLFHGSYTQTEVERVAQKLQQKLSIHLGELSYPFENTDEIGVPYINKKTKDEMDLILIEEISSTEGVENIIDFTSKIDDNRHYTLEFSVTIRGGEQAWLSIGV